MKLKIDRAAWDEHSQEEMCTRDDRRFPHSLIVPRVTSDLPTGRTPYPTLYKSGNNQFGLNLEAVPITKLLSATE